MVPTDILSIPVFEIFFNIFNVALPEYSVSYLFLQIFKHFINCFGLILSNKILLNFRPKTLFNCFEFSISTVMIFLVLTAFLINLLNYFQHLYDYL